MPEFQKPISKVHLHAWARLQYITTL